MSSISNSTNSKSKTGNSKNLNDRILEIRRKKPFVPLKWAIAYYFRRARTRVVPFHKNAISLYEETLPGRDPGRWGSSRKLRQFHTGHSLSLFLSFWVVRVNRSPTPRLLDFHRGKVSSRLKLRHLLSCFCKCIVDATGSKRSRRRPRRDSCTFFCVYTLTFLRSNNDAAATRGSTTPSARSRKMRRPPVNFLRSNEACNELCFIVTSLFCTGWNQTVVYGPLSQQAK